MKESTWTLTDILKLQRVLIFLSNQRVMFNSKNYLLQVKCRRKKHFLPWILTLKQTVDSMCNLYYLLLFFSLLWHCKISPSWWHTKWLLYWKSGWVNSAHMILFIVILLCELYICSSVLLFIYHILYPLSHSYTWYV